MTLKEIRVTCLCRAIKLADINLSLTKGQVLYLDESQARESQDLAMAVHLKAVTAVPVERCAIRRLPVEEKAHPTMKKMVLVSSIPAEPKSPSELDSLRKEIQALPGTFRDLLQKALSGLSLVSSTEASGTIIGVDNTLRYIPEGLVGQSKAEIIVEKGESQDSQVEKAVDTLKSLRGRKRIKKDE